MMKKTLDKLSSSQKHTLFYSFPCRWQGNSMVVLDGFKINPPYDTVVSSPGQNAGLERVIKVVSITLHYKNDIPRLNTKIF